jgi:hypothetical protein
MTNPNPIMTTPQQDTRSLQPFLRTPSVFSDLNNDKLYILLSLAKRTLVTRGALFTIPILQRNPYNIFDNSKYKQIACLGLKSQYNGTQNDLTPTLNAIHISSHSATFLPQGNASVDLVKNFPKWTNQR